MNVCILFKICINQERIYNPLSEPKYCICAIREGQNVIQAQRFSGKTPEEGYGETVVISEWVL